MIADQGGQKNRSGKTTAVLFRNVFYWCSFVSKHAHDKVMYTQDQHLENSSQHVYIDREDVHLMNVWYGCSFYVAYKTQL